MFLTLGIHNEPGVEKIKIDSSQKTVDRMLDLLLNKEDPEHSFVHFDTDSVVLLVNNLGGTSILELSAVTSLTAQLLSTFIN